MWMTHPTLGEVVLEQLLCFNFKTFNNQAKYEAMIVGLRLAQGIDIKKLVCKIDPQLTVGKFIEEFQVKDPMLLHYYHKVTNLLVEFQITKVEIIKIERNARADLLSKMD